MTKSTTSDVIAQLRAIDTEDLDRQIGELKGQLSELKALRRIVVPKTRAAGESEDPARKRLRIVGLKERIAAHLETCEEPQRPSAIASAINAIPQSVSTTLTKGKDTLFRKTKQGWKLR